MGQQPEMLEYHRQFLPTQGPQPFHWHSGDILTVDQNLTGGRPVQPVDASEQA